MAKALKLTFFICAVALAALLAIILLLKSRGGAARGAAGVGKAAGEATVSGDFDAMPVISAVGSLFSDEREDRIEDPGRRDEPFQVTCRGCGARFAPAPPRAACPFCGEAALVG